MAGYKNTKTSNLPMIHIQSVTPRNPLLDAGVLTPEIKMLMEEVSGLREETKSIACQCSDPNCPFNARREPKVDSLSAEEEEGKKSPDLGFGSMEGLDEQCKRRGSINTNRHSFPLSLKLLPPPPTFTQRPFLSGISTSLTNIPRGMHKRADGTIIEFDYPGTRREKKNGMTSGHSMTHLNRLSVCFHDDTEEDCQVDQDGLTSHHDYMFSRQAPERKILRNGKSNMKKDFSSTRDIPSSTFNYTVKDLTPIFRTDSSHSTGSLEKQRVSADTLSLSRHSSAESIKRHSISTTALDYTGRLDNFVRFKNFHLRRRSVLSS